MALKYRRDIDGLRSVAVLPVVLYHFSVPGFSGGFIGVDIFFVISGFLIGSILWAECSETGRISLVNFYIRRFRRLAPAFFAMCLATGIIGFAILLPFEFNEFSKSLIAATVYLSNVFFYRGAGYFDTIAEEKFLLHTWSLAVEEQFYVFLPLFLLLLGGRRGLTLQLSWILTGLSLLACVWITPRDHNAAFYLFPFRAWELFAGVLLAIHTAKRNQPVMLGALVSWIGIILLALSIFLIPAGPGFPGYLAIAPVLGTVLVLANGQDDNIVNRLLSARPAVFIGLISYSLYIWHWPVATLSLYFRGEYGGVAELLFWLALTFLISWASWKYIETPFRRGANPSPVRVFGAVGIGSMALLAYGAFIYFNAGLPNRFGPPARTHIDASRDFNQNFARCRVHTEGPFRNIEVCPIGPEEIAPDFIAWGDSHLRAFHDGLALAADEAQRSGLVIWRAGCPPLFGVSKTESAATRQQDESCTAANMQIRDALLSSADISDVLLMGRWSYYAEGAGTGEDAHNLIQLTHTASGAGLSNTEAFGKAVDQTVTELRVRGLRVFVLRQVPEIAYYNSRRIARMLAHGQLDDGEELTERTDIQLSAVKLRSQSSEAPFVQLSQNNSIRWLDTWPMLCEADVCSAMQGGRTLYYDNNHITNGGARALRGVFGPLLND